MPKIRRRSVPPALLNHLLDRIADREISAQQLSQFADWLATNPEVPVGLWFKTVFRADRVRRGGTGEDISTARPNSDGRRSEVRMEVKYPMLEVTRPKLTDSWTRQGVAAT